jgi:hypothetical protein
LFLGLALALLSEHSARARLTEREVPARGMKRRPRAAAASGTTFNPLIAAVGAPLARVLKPSHRNLSPRMKALRCGAARRSKRAKMASSWAEHPVPLWLNPPQADAGAAKKSHEHSATVGKFRTSVAGLPCYRRLRF